MATSCVRLAAIHPFQQQQTFRKPKQTLSSLPKTYVHANFAPSLTRTSCSFLKLLPITGQKHKRQFLSPTPLNNPFASSSTTTSRNTAICMDTTSCEKTPKIPFAEICMLVIAILKPTKFTFQIPGLEICDESYHAIVLELLGFQTCVHSSSEYLVSNTTNRKMASSSSLASQWIYETVKGCHEFKIKGYSLAKGMGVGKSMISGIFTVGGYDWVIVFYPDGLSESSKAYVSLFVKLVSSTKQVRALFEIKLLDQTGRGIHSLPKAPISPITFNFGDEWGFEKVMKRSELETSSYLKNDCLSIHCTVEVVEHRFETVQTISETTRPTSEGQFIYDCHNFV